MTVTDLIDFLKQVQSERSKNTLVYLRINDKDLFEISSLQFVRDKVFGEKVKDCVYVCARMKYPGVGL